VTTEAAEGGGKKTPLAVNLSRSVRKEKRKADRKRAQRDSGGGRGIVCDNIHIKNTPFPVPNWDTMRSNSKILDRIVYFLLQGDGEEAKFQSYSSLIAATKSGASGLAECASMMPFGSRICRATLNSTATIKSTATGKAFPQEAFLNCAEPNICATRRQPRAAAAGRTAET